MISFLDIEFNLKTLHIFLFWKKKVPFKKFMYVHFIVVKEMNLSKSFILSSSYDQIRLQIMERYSDIDIDTSVVIILLLGPILLLFYI